MITPDFIDEHHQEIEECAYQIYLMRQRYSQEDRPVENWNRACAIVHDRYVRK